MAVGCQWVGFAVGLRVWVGFAVGAQASLQVFETGWAVGVEVRVAYWRPSFLAPMVEVKSRKASSARGWRMARVGMLNDGVEET